MELPKRKPNRLSEYDYSQNGAYFITICSQDRCKILSDIVGDDAHIVPKPYGTIAEKYIRNVPEIEKYVIMPDHIHMIIRLDNGSMWASTPTDANVGAVTGRPPNAPSSFLCHCEGARARGNPFPRRERVSHPKTYRATAYKFKSL